MELNSPTKVLNENQTVSMSCEDICCEIDNIFSRLLDYDGRHIKATIQKLSDDHRELTKTDLFWSIALYECKDGRFVIGFYHVTEKTSTKRFVDSYGNFYRTQNAFLWNLLVKECWLYNLPQRIISVTEEDFLTCLKEGFLEFFDAPGEALLSTFIKTFQEDHKNKLLQLKAIYPFFQNLLLFSGVSFKKGEPFQIVINGNSALVGNIGSYSELEIIKDFLERHSASKLDAFTKSWEGLLDEMSKNKKISGWMNETERSAFEIEERISTPSQEKKDRHGATTHYLKVMNETFGNNQIFAYGCHKIALCILRKEYENGNKSSIDMTELKQLIYWIVYKSSSVYFEDKRAIVNNDSNIANYVDQFVCLLQSVQNCQKSDHNCDERKKIFSIIKNCNKIPHRNLDGLENDIFMCGVHPHYVRQFEWLLEELEKCNNRNIQRKNNRVFLHDTKFIRSLIKGLEDCNNKNIYRFVNNHSAAYHVNRHFDELKMCYTVFQSHNFLPKLEIIDELLKDLVNTSNNLQSESMEPDSDVTKNTKLKECLRFYLKVIPNFIFLENLYTHPKRPNGYYSKDGEKYNTYVAGNYIFGVKLKDRNNAITIYRK